MVQIEFCSSDSAMFVCPQDGGFLRQAGGRQSAAGAAAKL